MVVRVDPTLGRDGQGDEVLEHPLLEEPTDDPDAGHVVDRTVIDDFAQRAKPVEEPNHPTDLVGNPVEQVGQLLVVGLVDPVERGDVIDDLSPLLQPRNPLDE